MSPFEWAALLTAISAQWAAVAMAWINHSTVSPVIKAAVSTPLAAALVASRHGQGES